MVGHRGLSGLRDREWMQAQKVLRGSMGNVFMKVLTIMQQLGRNTQVLSPVRTAWPLHRRKTSIPSHERDE